MKFLTLVPYLGLLSLLHIVGAKHANESESQRSHAKHANKNDTLARRSGLFSGDGTYFATGK